MPWAVTKQLANRWSLIKTHIHEPWGVTKRALKPQLRPPTAKNYKVVYIHFKQLQTRYIDTPKNTHRFSDFLCYSPKISLYWLWHQRHRGRHHTSVRILQRHRQGRSSIWTHSQGPTILASSTWSITNTIFFYMIYH